MTKFLQDLLFKGALTVDGVVKLSNTAGTGTRMVVANALGVLSTQTIPAGGTDTLNDVTTRGNTTANAISVGGVTLTNNGNITTTNQLYVLASNYVNGIAVGYDSSAVYLGYSMTTLPIHIGSNGSGEIRFRNTGGFKIDAFVGTGTRMLVTDSAGIIGYQAVPSFSESDTLASVTTRGATTTNSISVGGLTVATPSGGAGILFNSTAGGGSQWSIQSYSSVNDIPNAIGFYNPVSATTPLVITPTKLQVKNSYQLIWGFDDAEYADSGIPNAGIAWEAANTLKFTNGSTGYGSLKALNVTATDSVYAKTKFTVDGGIAELGVYDSGSGGANINSYLSLFSNNNDGYGDGIALRFSRGSKASPAAVQAGDIAGGFYFKPYSGGVYATQSFIECLVTGVGSFAKTEMTFATSNGGNEGGFVWMTLKEDGELHLASPTTWTDKGAYRLQVDGAVYASGALFTSLAGTGTRMVVTDATGTLSSQAMPAGSLQGSVDADKSTSGSLSIGTTIVKSVSATTYSGVFFDYVVKNGTNVRVGSVVAISNGTNVEFYETLSNDIGATTNLTFTVTLGSGNINLNAVAAATGWTVIVSTRAI